jgi:deoxyribonuclease V
VIVAVDVDYRADAVVAACVGFDEWTDAITALEVLVRSDAPPAPYEPGRFYLRELPHIHAVLALLASPPDAIVVDGYVWLGDANPGLGARLHASLGGVTPVIGVAKTAFAGAAAIEVLRGTSARPLYVTTVGTDAQAAADAVRSMHGDHRIPTLLGRVDHLARSG